MAVVGPFFLVVVVVAGVVVCLGRGGGCSRRAGASSSSSSAAAAAEGWCVWSNQAAGSRSLAAASFFCVTPPTWSSSCVVALGKRAWRRWRTAATSWAGVAKSALRAAKRAWAWAVGSPEEAQTSQASRSAARPSRSAAVRGSSSFLRRRCVRERPKNMAEVKKGKRNLRWMRARVSRPWTLSWSRSVERPGRKLPPKTKESTGVKTAWIHAEGMKSVWPWDSVTRDVARGSSSRSAKKVASWSTSQIQRSYAASRSSVGATK
mmetsp:Transcript_9461/g.28888  ORF Transcript_9461/g.28888 Transcript_9461/m.28888 type:complete len:263 (+) Transcript_9461:352-1140(+)